MIRSANSVKSIVLERMEFRSGYRGCGRGPRQKADMEKDGGRVISFGCRDPSFRACSDQNLVRQLLRGW